MSISNVHRTGSEDSNSGMAKIPAVSGSEIERSECFQEEPLMPNVPQIPSLQIKNGIGEDLHPEILSSSLPLEGLIDSVPLPEDNDEVDSEDEIVGVCSSWRRLSVPESLELMVVVDFLVLFGKVLFGIDFSNMTLGGIINFAKYLN